MCIKFYTFLYFFVVTLCLAKAQTNNVVINCYIGSWAKDRTNDGLFTIDMINTTLCTHITYAFIGLTDTGDVDLLDSADDMPSFIALKQKKPTLKLLVAMGGYNQGSTTFSDVCNNDNLRTTLVNNIYNYLTTNGLDGIDIDWEYPAQRGGVSSDKTAFISLLQDLRTKLGDKFLLTAAVAAQIQSCLTSYDVANMDKYLDYYNIMSYDYHGSWENKTGQNSPLYPSSTNSNGLLNQNASIYGWMANGATTSKLLLGIAFYGRSFTLANPADPSLGAATTGPGTAGPYTNQAGILDYLEICQDINKDPWTLVFDNQQKVPYMSLASQWVGYDNVKSVTTKSLYAKNMKLGGVMTWTIDYDDVNNVCGDGKYPLLNAINDNLIELTPPTMPPTMPPTRSTSTISPPTMPPTRSTSTTEAITTTTTADSTSSSSTSSTQSTTTPTTTRPTITTPTTTVTSSTSTTTPTTTKPTTITTPTTTSTTTAKPTTITIPTTIPTTTTPTTTTPKTTPTTATPATTTPTIATPTTTTPTITTPTTTTPTSTTPTTTTSTSTTPTTTTPTTTTPKTTTPTTTTPKTTPTTATPATTTPTTTTPTTTTPTTTTPTTTPTTTTPTTTTPTTTTPTTTTTTIPTTTTTRPTTTTSTTTTTTTTTSAPTTTPKPGFQCTKPGTFVDLDDCSYYYQCLSDGFGGFIKYVFKCPADLWFDTRYYLCNYRFAVVGCR